MEGSGSDSIDGRFLSFLRSMTTVKPSSSGFWDSARDGSTSISESTLGMEESEEVARGCADGTGVEGAEDGAEGVDLCTEDARRCG